MGVRLVYQRDDSKYTVFYDKENLDGEKGPAGKYITDSYTF
jgi:hypothetical protein